MTLTNEINSFKHHAQWNVYSWALFRRWQMSQTISDLSFNRHSAILASRRTLIPTKVLSLLEHTVHSSPDWRARRLGHKSEIWFWWYRNEVRYLMFVERIVFFHAFLRRKIQIPHSCIKQLSYRKHKLSLSSNDFLPRYSIESTHKQSILKRRWKIPSCSFKKQQNILLV